MGKQAHDDDQVSTPSGRTRKDLGRAGTQVGPGQYGFLKAYSGRGSCVYRMGRNQCSRGQPGYRHQERMRRASEVNPTFLFACLFVICLFEYFMDKLHARPWKRSVNKADHID